MDTLKKYYVEGQSRVWYTNHYCRAVKIAKSTSCYGETVYIWNIRKKKICRIYRNGTNIKLRGKQ